MNFGEKFPYALPISSKNLFGLIGSHLPTKADCPAYTPHTSSKNLFGLIDWGLTSYHSPPTKSRLHDIYPTPTTRPDNSTHTPNNQHQPYTGYTPTIHQLYTHPIPLPCELTATKCGKNQRVFGP